MSNIEASAEDFCRAMLPLSIVSAFRLEYTAIAVGRCDVDVDICWKDYKTSEKD